MRTGLRDRGVLSALRGEWPRLVEASSPLSLRHSENDGVGQRVFPLEVMEERCGELLGFFTVPQGLDDKRRTFAPTKNNVLKSRDRTPATEGSQRFAMTLQCFEVL